VNVQPLRSSFGSRPGTLHDRSLADSDRLPTLAGREGLGKVNGISKSKVYALTAEWRHQVCGVAQKSDARFTLPRISDR
jgi:hypothetical protein